jgi:hypothetical protein
LGDLRPLPAAVLTGLQNEIGLALLEAMHEAELVDPEQARVYAVWLAWGPPPCETRYNPAPVGGGGWR